MVSPGGTDKAPDGGFGWVVVFASFMQHVLSIGIAYTIGVFYPVLMENFSLSSSAAAWVGAMHFATFFGMGPVSGWLTNKIGTAAVSFSGSVIAGLACCAAAYTNSIYVMIVLFGLVAGIGTGFMFMAAVAAVSRWFDTRRALATGMAVSGAGVGIFVFAPFLRLLIEHYGGEGAMLIEGGLAFQGCVFALLLRPLPARKSCKIQPNFLRDKNGILQIVEEETVPLEKSPIDSDQTIQFSTKVDGRFITMKDVLGSWIFWVFAGSQLLTFLSSMGPLVFLYNRAVLDHAIPPMQASYILSMLGVANTCGRLMFGALANRFPRSSLYLLSGTIMAYGAATAISVLGTSFSSLAIYAVIFGAAYGCMFALTTIVLIDLFGIQLFGPIYGNIGFLRGLAAVAGPPFAVPGLQVPTANQPILTSDVHSTILWILTNIGWLITMTGETHTAVFILKGLLGFVGGAILLAIPVFRSRRFAGCSRT